MSRPDTSIRGRIRTWRKRTITDGEGLTEPELLQVLSAPADELPLLLELAQDTRLAWCGRPVEVEGIVSIKTGGCPEDCRFCSQSGRFASPVRATTLDIPGLVRAARQTLATGATEFCIVAAVREPDARLIAQVGTAVQAIRADGNDINIACSLGLLDLDRAKALVDLGVHRYNHNLETARSMFPLIVTTHTWEERLATVQAVRAAGLELCCGGIIGLGETVAQRAEFAAQLGAITPEEVPVNFLDPRPGTPLANRAPVAPDDALRTAIAFRLAVPRATLRFAGGRELTLDDNALKAALLGGVNGLILGSYLTTLGRDPAMDTAMLSTLGIPIRALNEKL